MYTCELCGRPKPVKSPSPYCRHCRRLGFTAKLFMAVMGEPQGRCTRRTRAKRRHMAILLHAPLKSIPHLLEF